ncbi:hypothetical protein EXIGLDRAFT_661031, partial [Exidia glandulosa HHB12029]
MRYQLLSAGRALATLTRANTRSRRIFELIAAGRVQRASAALANAFKCGYGLLGTLNLLSGAAAGLNKIKSFTEIEYQKAFVLLKYGGAQAYDFASRAYALPSLRAVQRHSPTAVLEVSPGMPTIDELFRNLSTALSGSFQRFAHLSHGFALMIDEIAIERRLRWDPSTNFILGPCREHGGMCSLEFCSVDEAKALFRAIEAEKVHVASEATVLAIGAFSSDPIIYEARPFGISGTCKREKVEGQEQLIRTALEACKRLENELGPCYCIASDGDGVRRSAMAAITMCEDLPASSPLYPLLGPLPLFNRWTGPNALTCDIDMKHVAKRLRNTLLRVSGTKVNGVTITPLVLRAHLIDGGMHAETADALLNPNDHQDVVLMYRLLAAIARLPETSTNNTPISQDVRRVLWLLGQIYYYLLSAYTEVRLSVREQLEYLSAVAHMVMELYRSDRQAFIPSQLYIDIMIMVKNVFFCFAKTKVHDSKARFLLMLRGSDRLEKNFGLTRTSVGSDRNADVYQLSTRMLAMVQIALILAEHPEWHRGPRRLRLPPNILSEADLDSRVDHINPAAWVGDLTVTSVIPLTCWNHGRELA